MNELNIHSKGCLNITIYTNARPPATSKTQVITLSKLYNN